MLNVYLHAQEDSTAKLFQYSLASSIPAILTNLMLGSYSDFIGRKTIFIIMLVGRLVRDITTVVVVNFTLDLNFFFIGYGTDGLLGSVFAFYMAAFAFAADVTPPHKTRALALTVLESSKNVADAAIQAVIGYAIDYFGSLFAGLAVVQTMCYAISASIFNNIYEYTVDDFRGTVFLAMAGSNFIAAIFLLMSMHVTKRRQSKMRRILHIQHPDEKQAESD
ncbi:uncharacterized protein LOC126821395 [Patella vulgata]|uniref:uncharacterized protein LOC126821395 n=1 Tax=Patella vulgata TaxID=6465 RepID=UPI00217F8AF1|nr:uncharacterized protein LOC126821395 [Patella vulgata]